MQSLTSDDQGYGDLGLSELVAHDYAVVAIVGDLRIEDGQIRMMRLIELGTQLRLETLAFLDQNTFPIPRNLRT